MFDNKNYMIFLWYYCSCYTPWLNTRFMAYGVYYFVLFFVFLSLFCLVCACIYLCFNPLFTVYRHYSIYTHVSIRHTSSMHPMYPNINIKHNGAHWIIDRWPNVLAQSSNVVIVIVIYISIFKIRFNWSHSNSNLPWNESFGFVSFFWIESVRIVLYLE